MQGTDRSETDIAIFQNLANPKFVDFSQSPKEVIGNYSKNGNTSQKSALTGKGAFSQRVQTIIKSTTNNNNNSKHHQQPEKLHSSSSSSRRRKGQKQNHKSKHDSSSSSSDDDEDLKKPSKSKSKGHKSKHNSSSSSDKSKRVDVVHAPLIPPPPLMSSKQYQQPMEQNNNNDNNNYQKFPLNAPFVHARAPSIRASHKVFEQQPQQRQQQQHSDRHQPQHQRQHSDRDREKDRDREYKDRDRDQDRERDKDHERHSNRRSDRRRHHSDRNSNRKSDRHSNRHSNRHKKDNNDNDGENNIRKMQADEFFRGNEYDPDDEEVKMEKNRVLMELDGLEKKYNIKLYRKFTLKDSLSEMKFALDQYNTDLDVKAGVGFLKFAIPLLLSGIEKGNHKFLKGWLKIDGFSQDIRKDMSDPLESTKWDYVLDRVYRRYFRKSTSKSPLRQLTEMLVWGLALKHIQQALPGGQFVAAIASGFLQDSLHPKPPVTRFTPTSNVPNMSNSGEQVNSPHQFQNGFQNPQFQQQQQQPQYTQTGYNPQNVPPVTLQQQHLDIPLNQPVTMNPVTLPINRNLTEDKGGSRRTLKRPSTGFGVPISSHQNNQNHPNNQLQQPLHPLPVQRAPSNEEYIQKGRLMEQEERIRILEAQLQTQQGQFQEHAQAMQSHFMNELKKATVQTQHSQNQPIQQQQHQQQNIPKHHSTITPVVVLEEKHHHDKKSLEEDNEPQCKLEDDNEDKCSVSSCSVGSESNSTTGTDEEENDKKNQVLNRNDKVLHNTLLQAGIVLDPITEE